MIKYKLIKSDIIIEFNNSVQEKQFLDMMKDSKVEFIKL